MNVTAIFGAPRSGTSWLGQLFNSSYYTAYRFQPLFSYEFKGRITLDSSPNDITQFYKELKDTQDNFVLQSNNISGKELNFGFHKEDVSHLVWKEVRYHHLIEHIIQHSGTRFIGIIRHPCAVINSWINAPKEFNGYEKWKELAFLYLRLSESYPNSFKIVLYEDLNLRAQPVLQKLFSYAQIPWDKQVEDFIYKSQHTQDDDAYGVLKAKKKLDSWKKTLQPQIQHEIFNDPDFIQLNHIFQWNT